MQPRARSQPPEIPGYRDLRLLGIGGMASVYLGVQESLERHVALKLLDGGDPARHQRFLNESRIIASLNHRNVVTIHDVGMIDGRPYISMEYLRGGDLEHRLSASAVDANQALDLVEAMAACLDFVHRHGVIHRDVKPANILFHEDGTPILTDFGLAKQQDSDSRLTIDGTTVGTPYYLSPEQAECKPLDGRTDVYGLGVILYEMLTGSKPYEGASAMGTIVAHLTDPIPLLPEELSRYQPLIDRVLAKDPAERFATAGDLLAYIRALRARDALPHPVRDSARTAVTALGGAVRRAVSAAVDATTGAHARRRKSTDTPSSAHSDDPARSCPRMESSPRRGFAVGAMLLITAIAAGAYLSGGSRSSVQPAESSVEAEPAPAAVATQPALLTEPAVLTEAGVPGPAAEASEPEAAAAATEPAPVAEARERSPAAEYVARAERALQGNRLSQPREDSALYYYQQALALEPGRADALQGLATIAERYADLAENEMEALRFPNARTYIARGLQVQPDHVRLLLLEERVRPINAVPQRIESGVRTFFNRARRRSE